MRIYQFYQLDVFTKNKFEGNPLAVFPEAVGISESEMQKIANEMNLSETVFVLPSEKALKRLRIFTPKRELPLAGHPVVGTWNLLARLGVTPKTENGFIEIEQELNLGVLPVHIEFRNNEPFQVIMTQGKFEASETVSDQDEIGKLADSLGLKIEDLNISEDLPVQTVSTGIKSLAVPLKSLSAMSKIKVNSSLLSDIYLSHDAIGCYVFSFETKEETSKVHTRFFAPDDNISEDPATGSAAGALSGYLVHHGAIKGGSPRVSKGANENSYQFTIEQGDFMNRPSRIFADVTGEKGNVESVKIGGSSVVIAKGEVYL
ncbi:MAG: PhzF family phenazine biosynthesis protein [Pyrinomonadaceae bacterium]